MIIVISFKGPMQALLHSVLPTLQQATANPHFWQTLLDTRREVWVSLCGVTTHLSWVLVHIRLSLCPPRFCPQSFVNSGGSIVWLMVTSSKRAYAIPWSTAPKAPAPTAVHAEPYPHRRHSNRVLAQSLWGLWVLVHTRFI